jgi:predicted NUDIX family NTP pyrophosphohydrolase
MSGPVRSAGLLPYRQSPDPQVLLAHPGGPYFARRDEGWWSIVKGGVEKGESDEDAACREFAEETGWDPPPGQWIALGETTLRSGKTVVAWAVKADFDPIALKPGMFSIGRRRYPEIDRVAWFDPDQARRKLNAAQGEFIDRLLSVLSSDGNNVGEPKP